MNCPKCNLKLHECLSDGTNITSDTVFNVGGVWPTKIICTKRQKYMCINPTCNSLEVITTEIKDYAPNESQK